MPFNYSADTSRIEKILTDMHDKLKKLSTDMGDEMFNWQAEDLHRKQPHQRGRYKVATVIHPHSLEMKRTRRNVLRARRRKGGRGPAMHRSTRPILRQEIYDMLVERMQALLARVRW